MPYAAAVENVPLMTFVTSHCEVLTATAEKLLPSTPVSAMRSWSVVAATAPNVAIVAVLALTEAPNVEPFSLSTTVISSPAAVIGVRIQLPAAVVELVPISMMPRAASAVDVAVLCVIPVRLYVTAVIALVAVKVFAFADDVTVSVLSVADDEATRVLTVAVPEAVSVARIADDVAARDTNDADDEQTSVLTVAVPDAVSVAVTIEDDAVMLAVADIVAAATDEEAVIPAEADMVAAATDEEAVIPFVADTVAPATDDVAVSETLATSPVLSIVSNLMSGAAFVLTSIGRLNF